MSDRPTRTTSDRQGATVKVTLIKSTIGCNRAQRLVVEGLGLRRIRHVVTLQDTPSVRGMIHKVRHLVAVEQV